MPQQENGYDCGVFVMLFFETFLNRKVSLTFSVSYTMKLLTEKYIIFHLQAELPKADLLIQSDFISLLFYTFWQPVFVLFLGREFF